MQLTQSQGDIIRRFWIEREVKPRCSACGSSELHLDDRVMFFVDPSDGFQVPFVFLLCTNCMHADMFLADPILIGPSGYNVQPLDNNPTEKAD